LVDPRELIKTFPETTGRKYLLIVKLHLDGGKLLLRLDLRGLGRPVLVPSSVSQELLMSVLAHPFFIKQKKVWPRRGQKFWDSV
jgi:hypothetical protein